MEVWTLKVADVVASPNTDGEVCERRSVSEGRARVVKKLKNVENSRILDTLRAAANIICKLIIKGKNEGRRGVGKGWSSWLEI